MATPTPEQKDITLVPYGTAIFPVGPYTIQLRNTRGEQMTAHMNWDGTILWCNCGTGVIVICVAIDK